jgi:hypothetical protein
VAVEAEEFDRAVVTDGIDEMLELWIQRPGEVFPGAIKVLLRTWS